MIATTTPMPKTESKHVAEQHHCVYVGIDNGVTGSVGVINGNHHAFWETPIMEYRNYTKKVGYLKRIDHLTLTTKLLPYHGDFNVVALIERPMVNPRAFVATESALRALEATIIVLETLAIPYRFVDSKAWQRKYLSAETIGGKSLKLLSRQVGIQLFPECKQAIEKHGDADGLLIAAYARDTHPFDQ